MARMRSSSRSAASASRSSKLAFVPNPIEDPDRNAPLTSTGMINATLILRSNPGKALKSRRAAPRISPWPRPPRSPLCFGHRDGGHVDHAAHRGGAGHDMRGFRAADEDRTHRERISEHSGNLISDVGGVEIGHD